MEASFALVIAGAALVGGLAAVLILRAARARPDGASLAELSGRLSQLAESQAAAQNQISERLRAQERELAKILEGRLDEVARRVTEALAKSAGEASKTMGDLKERLAVIDAAQKNITELSSQVVGLQDILANKQARGAFGDVQLQNLVRDILPPSAYQFQATLSNGKRVDCLIKLPNPPGPIAIDAKFPLESYRALRNAADEAARQAAARSFGTDIMTHVRDIADKYSVPGETAEWTLMFLPSEAVYAEVHANFPEVVEKARRARVGIVSPTTMMAILNTVRAVLKDVRMREQAGVIQIEVRTMMEDVLRLDDRVAKLQRHFELAYEDMRQIRISTEKVTRRAERIEDVELEDQREEKSAAGMPPPPEAIKAD